MDNGETVILTDADFADLPLPTTRTLDVLQFVPLEQVDPIYFNKSYFLEPEKSATKPYVLLRDALERSEMVAVVKVAIRTREQLATLRVRDGVIVLETMLWPDEIRTPDFAFLDEDVQVRAPEQKMADSLVASMAGDFDADEYTDEYREALQQVIDAKAEGREVVDAPADTSSGPANVVDLMAALRASVDAAKARRATAARAVASAEAKPAKPPRNRRPSRRPRPAAKRHGRRPPRHRPRRPRRRHRRQEGDRWRPRPETKTATKSPPSRRPGKRQRRRLRPPGARRSFAACFRRARVPRPTSRPGPRAGGNPGCRDQHGQRHRRDATGPRLVRKAMDGCARGC